MIIDTHVHCGKGTITDPMQSGGSRETLLQVMDYCGIDKACIFPHFHKDGYKLANKELAIDFEMINPNRFIPFIRFNFYDKVLENLNYQPKGAKVHFRMDGIPSLSQKVVLEKRKLPLVIHGGNSIKIRWIKKHLLDNSFSFPIIIAHFGGYPLDMKLYKETYQLLNRYDKVYVDTSFVYLKHILENFINDFPDRVLYGSDFPAVHPALGILAIKTINISDEHEAMVLGGNAKRLLRL